MAMAQGARLLGEIEIGTLDELLRDFKTTHDRAVGAAPERLSIPELDEIWGRRGGQLYVCGRYRPLLYHIVSAAVAAPRLGVALVVDVDGKFDVTRLNCSMEDLKHVYVFRPANGVEGVKACLEEGTRWLVYGQHGSRGRELVVKVVSGGAGQGAKEADVVGCWRGWMRVRSGAVEVPKFGMGMSVEEASRERVERQEAVEKSAWWASSDYGHFKWMED